MSTAKLKRYLVKAIIFDVQAECRELKQELADEGIFVMVPFFGLKVEQTLLEMFKDTDIFPKDCLMITNSEQHAKIAESLGVVVIGCMEGHFNVPKTATLLENPEEVSVNYLNQVYCHQKKLPATIAETTRCYIQEMTSGDMDALYEILTDEETAKYLPAKAGSREEELEKLVSYVSHVYSFFGYGYWGIFSKETGELIGRAGFREGEFPLEAGYVIKRSHWGQGYATEVLSELVHYAEEELGISEIYANIDERNIASLRVAEKCGVLCNRLRV